jgi:ketosteroid isomerase-like protein
MRGEDMTPIEFMQAYEQRTNTHNFQDVAPLIADDAIYWFNDGSFYGVDEIRQAFERTWGIIQNERYRIESIQWIISDENAAVCTYMFHWQGIVEGQSAQGEGRGTSVLANVDGKWKVLHERLSPNPH